MNRKQKILSTAILMAFVLLWFGMTGFSASKQAEKPVADEVIGSSGITWVPKVNYAQLALTVSRPDGSVFEKKFDSGSTPYLDLSNIYGTGGNDGSYTYELRAVPYSEKKIRKEGTMPAEREMGRRSLPQKVLTQTGYFMVQGGSIMAPGTSEEGLSRVMDIYHYDDVIITGSQCIGYDCKTDGTEDFAYDTIRLKENNMQIHFDDTSTSVGFPANDWRIIINDSASGGGNYFAVQDTTEGSTPFKIEAGASSNALYVDDAGRLGLGTATPIYNIHIQYGDSPAIRFHQDTSYGWTEQKWDISGNESNFFIRDATNGSKLPFRIQPAAPTNSIYIKSDGKIGMGTSSPAYPLEIDTTGADCCLLVKRTDGATNYVNATASYANFGSTTDHPLRLVVNSAWKLRLNSDNSLSMASGASCTAGGTWTNASSRALKENIQSLGTDEAMDTLNRLNPVKFNYKVDKAEKHVGFIAEDAPELVSTPDRKGMSPMDVVAVLTKVVQEQQKTISELKEKIDKLENK